MKALQYEGGTHGSFDQRSKQFIQHHTGAVYSLICKLNQVNKGRDSAA